MIWELIELNIGNALWIDNYQSISAGIEKFELMFVNKFIERKKKYNILVNLKYH